ncbi:MAG: 30S ribosomal protein S15 [Phytoplasma sp.]|uniref:30S ribosomal protein S15 n=1 Tax=Phytoplasma sp. TaxID=2155 RepID=UPI002B40B080|nr:30S ribosomal protein S15 [Phytoplasma sp.]WRH06952.1 MAG: 30S ribosomal protein S15 [Phytoplasma sp.]
MALTKKQKKDIILQTIDSEVNTGCTEVQIAILSREIEELNKHLKEHPSDFHSKRGLLIKNKKRSTLIKYLKTQIK